MQFNHQLFLVPALNLCYNRLAAFNIERIEYRNIIFTFWDVGGHAPVYITMLSTPSAYRDCLVLADVTWLLLCFLQNRPLWKYYFHDTQGLVFVVDSNDRDRIRLARDELNTLLNAVHYIYHAMFSLFCIIYIVNQWFAV